MGGETVDGVMVVRGFAVGGVEVSGVAWWRESRGGTLGFMGV